MELRQIQALRRIRVAAILIFLLALASLAGQALMFIAIAVATLAVAVLAMAMVGLRREEPLPAVVESVPPPAPKAEPEVTVLVADLRDESEDLRRVLEGIVRDERGKIAESGGSGITAVFRGRRDHAQTAVHAAQRMLSNVEALSRRLERDIRITIGVDSGPEEAAAARAAELQKTADENRMPVLVSANTFERLPSERAVLAAIDADARLYTFTPVQQRLF
jgi:hypothetical protein